ncbi:hypothetical protein ABVD54_004952 [Vibrio parahaemolyticus]|uniref:hypothetical protein n=1 Tax=Vibrio parahaemolyticus TaxID=670 RepID=UPI000470816F|nr:hypothetical protein [Vibrio parahaemolyticus]KIT37780.1 hypothetical protein H320_24225 [Vibrio parahaemolyticus 49]EGQ7815768.1 hypothetical protein [Vibrio parahaemolyticus]EGQ8735113.1 hypothetical protein [Vibrio parahaemolyticus]EGQ8886994.1 hypothetical protein [Vibrio parahaemolyticus]EGQ8917844.1 hypothetical protein [Vibrio parahaemolyticus]
MRFLDRYLLILVMLLIFLISSWGIGMMYFGQHPFSFNSQDWANFATFITGISSLGAAFISVLLLRKTLQQQTHQLKIDNLRIDVEKLEISIVKNWFNFEYELEKPTKDGVKSIPYILYFENMYRNREPLDRKALEVIPDLLGNFILLLRHARFYISEYKKIEANQSQREALEVTAIAYWQSTYRFNTIILLELSERAGIDLNLSDEDREVLEYFVLY